LAEHGEIVSGTYSGDVTGLTAVLDTLEVYTSEPVIETLWARGRQLMDGLRQVIPPTLGTVEGSPVHPRIRFTDPQTGQPYDYRPSEARPLTHAFKAAMAERGILVYPDWLMVMAAHTEQQINQVIEAAEQACRAMRI
jgi:glutamate-1-semialdehyde 2,1-aminomutase